MEQEALLVGSLERVDVLLVLACAERGNHERLGFAAREQRRTMGARQDADLSEDRAHRAHVTTVDADAGVENVPANDLRLQVVEDLADELLVELRGFAGRQQSRVHLRLDGVDGGIALLLHGLLVGFAQLGFGDGRNRLLDFALLGKNEIARLLGGLLGEADDRLDHGLEATMTGHDRVEHGFFGKLPGFRFHHQHGVGRSGDDEVESRVLHLVDGRVQLELAVDIADAGAADRAHEWNARQGQGCGGRNHCQNVGIVLEIMGENGHDNLGVVAIAVREERADRAVDQAGDERLLFGGAPLALEIAAGNAAGRESLFLVIYGEREKVHARLGRFRGNDGGQQRGFAPACPDGAVGLTRHTARLKHELAPGPVQFFTMDFEHSVQLSWLGKCKTP